MPHVSRLDNCTNRVQVFLLKCPVSVYVYMACSLRSTFTAQLIVIILEGIGPISYDPNCLNFISVYRIRFQANCYKVAIMRPGFLLCLWDMRSVSVCCKNLFSVLSWCSDAELFYRTPPVALSNTLAASSYFHLNHNKEREKTEQDICSP